MASDKLIIAMSQRITKLEKLVQTQAGQIDSQHKLLNQTIVLCRNFDTKIETLKKYLIASHGFTEAAFEELFDQESGMAKREDGDIIQKGDVVWVSYEAKDEHGATITEDNFPCRAGAGALLFDKWLIGQAVGAAGLVYDGDFEGTKLKFTINIRKAKYKIGGTDGDDTGVESGQAQPLTEVGGPGHQEHSSGVDQPVQ